MMTSRPHLSTPAPLRAWGVLGILGILGTLSILGVLGVLGGPSMVYADGGDLAVPEGQSGQSGPDLPQPPPKKASGSALSGGLTRLAAALSSPAGLSPGAGRVSGPDVVVSIRISSDSSRVSGAIDALGGWVANIGPDFVEARVPVDRLAAVAALDGVSRVSFISRPAVNVTTQGTAVHRSTLWNTHGFSGSGIKVGVIDGGFEGYVSLMGTELPATVQARCYTSIGVFSANPADCESGGVHGTAVAETIFDVAPGVTLYISNPVSQGDLQTTVAWMAAQGVQVINYSVGWIWDGPGDGTSPFSESPLASVDTAVATGIVWVNAAGNSAEQTWFAGYQDSVTANGWLEFTAGGGGTKFSVPLGRRHLRLPAQVAGHMGRRRQGLRPVPVQRQYCLRL